MGKMNSAGHDGGGGGGGFSMRSSPDDAFLLVCTKYLR